MYSWQVMFSDKERKEIERKEFLILYLSEFVRKCDPNDFKFEVKPIFKKHKTEEGFVTGISVIKETLKIKMTAPSVPNSTLIILQKKAKNKFKKLIKKINKEMEATK